MWISSQDAPSLPSATASYKSKRSELNTNVDFGRSYSAEIDECYRLNEQLEWPIRSQSGEGSWAKSIGH